MGNLINDEFKKKIKAKLDKVEAFQRVLPEKDLQPKVKKWLEFEEKHPDKIFNDGFRDYLFVQTPDKAEENKPKEVGENGNFLWRAKFKLGGLSVFGTRDQLASMGWNNTVAITGKLKTRYTVPGSGGYFDSFEKMVEVMEWDTDNVDGEDYLKLYSVSVYQVIE